MVVPFDPGHFDEATHRDTSMPDHFIPALAKVFVPSLSPSLMLVG